MSINMDADGQTDYSDFQYQQGQAQIRVNSNPTDSNSRVKASFNIEPLAARAGLDVNEVAELVYMDASLNIEYDDEDVDQNVASYTEARFVIGSNLPETGFQIEPSRGELSGQAQAYEASIPDGDFDLAHRDISEDRVFQLLRTNGGAPFDDDTNGPGGNANGQIDRVEKNWRELTGRGPVLDSSDDISIVGTLVNGDVIMETSAVLRYHFVWDTAEVDDAGRAFSVPM